jgi:hypothetical protein
MRDAERMIDLRSQHVKADSDRQAPAAILSLAKTSSVQQVIDLSASSGHNRRS